MERGRQAVIVDVGDYTQLSSKSQIKDSNIDKFIPPSKPLTLREQDLLKLILTY